MSSALYLLGHRAYRARWLVVGIWVAILLVVGGSAALFGKGTDNSFSIPGTESQAAIDQLNKTFPQVSGSNAQIVVEAPDGQQITDPAIKADVSSAVTDLEDGEGVVLVTDPYDDQATTALSPDGTTAIINVQFDRDPLAVTEEMRGEVNGVVDNLRTELPTGSTVVVGGSAMSVDLPEVGTTELVGLLVALVVLVITFASFLAAGMPLVTALLGVIITSAGIMAATAFTQISSTTPLLALMLGLAVGIDYSLFIVSRHLDQVRHGMDPEESAARSVATAGSAVIFAGLTVIIALVGLSVTMIPFLAIMGLAAAAGVAMAVLVALTMTPALLGFAGKRLAKKLGRRNHAEVAQTETRMVAKNRFLEAWVRAATWKPVLTIVVVVAGLVIVALPARELQLALPDSGSKPSDSQARQAYDLISEKYGPGYNGPLLLSGSILDSNDPLQLMKDVQAEIEQLPGVVAVPVATPNESADTGILQVIPEGAPDSQATADLVNELRSAEPAIAEQYGYAYSVTGNTAAAIDVSSRLSQALLPFALLVVGLCLILLTMVFRSLWVPIKATIGYLLSIGAAFGVIVMVFQWGWFNTLLNVEKTGPVLSFLPIVVMGVLFGLAMDYEVFLVARMREEHVHGAKARDAVRRGFLGSGKVVIAAALIMFAVFASFVPTGDITMKSMALGLAVGVFVDAFIVRMTLVPAVMYLLGEKAWYLPKWLDNRLPFFDVEGEAIERELQLEDWPEDSARWAIAADAVVLPGVKEPFTTRTAFGETLEVAADQREHATSIALVLAGRSATHSGKLRVAGYLLPERAAAVRKHVALALLRDDRDPVKSVARVLKEQPTIVILDGIDQLTDPLDQDQVRALIEHARTENDALTVVTTSVTVHELLELA